MSTFGTALRDGLTLSFNVSFDGTSKDWGTTRLININPLSNSGDTLNEMRKIGDATIRLSDHDGSLWTEFGNGTTAFNKSLSLDVVIGGTYGFVTHGLETRYELTGQTGESFRLHTGKIVNISKRNKAITLVSQNKMNLLDRVKWQMPVQTSGQIELGSYYGSYAFSSDTSWWSTYIDVVGFNVSDKGTFIVNNVINNTGSSMDFYGYAGSQVGSALYQGTGLYDTTGTGINDFLHGSFSFLDTYYHLYHDRIKFSGTVLGTHEGTLVSDEQARSFGFSRRSEAAPYYSGTFLVINKVRVDFHNTADNTTGSWLNLYQKINLTGDPIAVAKHCLFGKMVSDYYGTNDIGSSFASSQPIVAFQSYNQDINPDDEYVIDYINDAIQSTQAIFFVNNNDLFEFMVYKPLDFSQTIDLIGSSQIIDSEYMNDINDFTNRVILNYNYDYEAGSFYSKFQSQSSDWTPATDRLIELETKWIKNTNQARNVVNKILSRRKNTLPEINVTTTLEHIGKDIGSLVSIEDPDSFSGTKIVEIIAYDKDFEDSRDVVFRCYDGEALYKQNGYAKWEDSALNAVVSGTSTSGASDSAGTVLNINNALYGSVFRWW